MFLGSFQFLIFNEESCPTFFELSPVDQILPLLRCPPLYSQLHASSGYLKNTKETTPMRRGPTYIVQVDPCQCRENSVSADYIARCINA